jgi:penicillin-binding protein 2
VRADLRNDFTSEQIELVRHGLWEVVNEDGGTGRVARMQDVEVAGKTGTAEVMSNGKAENVAWFCCFAPFDHPKYAIAVMVQGASGHGGPVAGPIADRILERTLAMDAGKFEPQLAWVAPAHHDDPFKLVAAVSYKDELPETKDNDEEDSSGKPAAENTQMAQPGGAPDVEAEADARGRVQNASRSRRVFRAEPVATPPAQRPRNFFERMFNRGPRPAAPTPTPTRRARPAF